MMANPVVHDCVYPHSRLRAWTPQAMDFVKGYIHPGPGPVDPELLLYAAHTYRQKQRAVPWLLATGVLMNIFVVLIPGNCNVWGTYILAGIGLLLTIVLALLYRYVPTMRVSLPFLVWLLLWCQVIAHAMFRAGDAYNELLGWAVLVQFLTVAAVPYNYLEQGVIATSTFCCYVSLQFFNGMMGEEELHSDFYDQQIVNLTLLLVATVLGCAAYKMREDLQRSSFLETKKSLRDKLVIEQQSKEQEQLLLSVLPEHVAVQMRQELGLIDTQFKKIYMSRHENVSILYADIVGFTAISSTYSAQDLVAILNELFARFDRLAEKYKQLRIKILGDCYYCISGAPVERPDHAALCVHMGLSMVKAIKYVQQTTNSPVDMRVGIHTGAVLAGVLGQRQWQFDVYSRDVELANKMESSGLAGRVHISEATLGFLTDEFEVEPAYGEKREEMLRQAGIKTYFIVKVLKPYQGHEDKGGGEKGKEEKGEGGKGGAGGETSDADSCNDLKDDDDEDSVLTTQEDIILNEQIKILTMLNQELLSRDDSKELEDATTFWLSFKDPVLEIEYLRRPEPSPVMVASLPFLLFPVYTMIANFTVPSPVLFHLLWSSLVLETAFLYLLYYKCNKKITNKAVKPAFDPMGRIIICITNIIMYVIFNLLPLIMCGIYETTLRHSPPTDELSLSEKERCLHPSYYYHVAVAISFSVLWVPIGLLHRGALLLTLAALHIIPSYSHNALLHTRDIDYNPYGHWTPNGSCASKFDLMPNYNSTPNDNLTISHNEDLHDILETLHEIRHILMLFFIAIALIIFNRYSESLERARYSRGLRMRAQAEQAADLRRRNQALVHNVLPPHVARHFMGARHNHRDLYSQSYAEVGVLFASMPNFSEFYSEETVNNQGLECLRFLNEVISDFDMLLEDPRFCKDIIKIKTISSTYMAASGLNPTREMELSDGVAVRWAHLACLVEFALELQKTITAINEQSFNHFVLRLGVNHGPITAGVIGARKPHYDIWGNTVNVASRMESTGKAGCIQVTEETCEILQMFGYYFEQRGLVAVKGKGQLMTYYLHGKKTPPSTPIARLAVENVNNGDATEVLPGEKDAFLEVPEVKLTVEVDEEDHGTAQSILLPDK